MDPSQITKKRILFAVLNWGLGHASRSARLISELSRNNEVIIASDGQALLWLQTEFPSLTCISFPALNMSYSKRFGAIGGILKKIPHFLKSIKRDQNALMELYKHEKVDLIISDNRYGVYSEKIPSILLSHQLRLISPFSHLFQLPLYNLIEKFTEIWVPDNEDRKLSGLLSLPENSLNIPINYIGSLSRFSTRKEDQNRDIHFLLIASGPEPHRSQLVDYFEANFSLITNNCHIVAADNSRENYTKGNLTFHSTTNTKELEKLIGRADYVICRSGYSSIMDLVKLNQKAILIPTPGQAEQEYLARFHKDYPTFISVLNQKELPKIMKNLI